MELEKLIPLLPKKGLELRITGIVELWVVTLRTREGANFTCQRKSAEEAVAGAYQLWWEAKEKPIKLSELRSRGAVAAGDLPWFLYAEVVQRLNRLQLSIPSKPPETLTLEAAVVGAEMLGFIVEQD